MVSSIIIRARCSEIRAHDKLFMFYRVISRLALHSFPTLRSSVLDVLGDDDALGVLPRAFADAVARVHRRRRTEEHTSELQSRLHLVCRLPLEKKKTSTIVNIVPSSSTQKSGTELL